MHLDFLLRQKEWSIAIGLFVGLLVAALLGALAAKHVAEKTDEEELARSTAGTVHAGVLGLLALLLGFSFSMAIDRFDRRRMLIREEANAIALAYRRAELAGEPERDELKAVLRRYIDLRVHLYAIAGNMEEQEELDTESEAMHREMYTYGVAVARRDPSDISALLVDSLDEVITMHTYRISSMINHVPSALFWLLFVVSACSTALTGYTHGSWRDRRWIPTAILLVLITVVIMVIVDLDRPQKGMIQIGQWSLLDAQRRLSQ